MKQVKASQYGAEYTILEKQYAEAFQQKKIAADNFSKATESNISQANAALKQADARQLAIRAKAIALIKKNDSKSDATNDTNYVFLNFVTHFLPRGLIGLLIAIVMLAAM